MIAVVAAPVILSACAPTVIPAGGTVQPPALAADRYVAADGTALPGPDSDSFKGEWREAGGKGVHFSGPGLEQHARLWLEKIAPWLEEQLKP